MSKKKVTFPARPCPPAGADIVRDISKAANDDILFQLEDETSADKSSCSETAPVSSLMVESFMSQDDVPFSPELVREGSADVQSPQRAETAAIDTVYRQAHQFLQISDKLQHTPQTLQAQCRHLEKLGAELRHSIDTLKTETQDNVQTT